MRGGLLGFIFGRPFTSSHCERVTLAFSTVRIGVARVRLVRGQRRGCSSGIPTAGSQTGADAALMVTASFLLFSSKTLLFIKHSSEIRTRRGRAMFGLQRSNTSLSFHSAFYSLRGSFCSTENRVAALTKVYRINDDVHFRMRSGL